MFLFRYIIIYSIHNWIWRNWLINYIKRISVVRYAWTIPSNCTLWYWMTLPLIPYLNTLSILTYVNGSMSRISSWKMVSIINSRYFKFNRTVWKSCNCCAFWNRCTFYLIRKIFSQRFFTVVFLKLTHCPFYQVLVVR